MTETLAVEPKAGATPPVAPEPANPAAAAPAQGEEASADASKAANLPKELLQVPAIQAVLAGQPAAVSADIAEFTKRPEGKLIQQNAQPLMKAGMGLYRSMAGNIGVLFNQFYIHPDELKQADQAGQLAEVAPPFDVVNQAVGQSGQKNPVLGDVAAPKGFKTAAVSTGQPPPIQPTPPGVAPGVMPPRSSAKAIGAKARNAIPGSPTSGPKPGAGRLLNQILKPVI